jgi:hypothetical protein
LIKVVGTSIYANEKKIDLQNNFNIVLLKFSFNIQLLLTKTYYIPKDSEIDNYNSFVKSLYFYETEGVLKKKLMLIRRNETDLMNLEVYNEGLKNFFNFFF